MLILFSSAAYTTSADIPTGSIEFETGAVWQSMNNVQIPNNENGTRYSLYNLAGKGPWLAGRIYLTMNLAPKHDLRLLVAPLDINEKSVFDKTILFAGRAFSPGPIDTRYKFNSYRLTYRYLYYAQRWKLRIGFTAKIRDAIIELNRDNNSARKKDLGFVPLLHLSGEYSFTPRTGFLFDLDALAGGPGRAEDLALKLYYDPNTKWRLAAGYRTVEGGADVEEVYNFAWLHYAIISLKYSF
ncbi:hypothetical protein ACFL50_04665 [Candidatus Latescibacterota bacterium]